MMKRLAFAAALAVFPATAFAQSTGPLVRDPAGGATRDPALMAPGAVATPPLTRDPAGGTMIDDSRFRAYVVEQRVPSYTYARPVVVGEVLPSDGIVYREVPAQYGPSGYRYTVVNERTVVVDPVTRRIVQIIE